MSWTRKTLNLQMQNMDQLLTWSEEFALGHPALDRDHRGMVNLINDIIAVVRSEKHPAPLLKVLQALTTEHIQRENRVLWQIQTGTHDLVRIRPQMRQLLSRSKANFDDHIDEHRGFLARLDAIVRGASDTLCEELKGWFSDHALGYDASLKAIFEMIR